MTERLIDMMDDLRDELVDTRPLVEKALARSRRATWVAAAGIVVCLIAAALAVDAHLAADRAQRAIERADELTLTARIAGCVRDNVVAAKTRSALVDGLLVFVPDPAALTAEQRARVDAYTAAVINGLDFRDCSPAGIAADIANPPVDPATLP